MDMGTVILTSRESQEGPRGPPGSQPQTRNLTQAQGERDFRAASPYLVSLPLLLPFFLSFPFDGILASPAAPLSSLPSRRHSGRLRLQGNLDAERATPRPRR